MALLVLLVALVVLAVSQGGMSGIARFTPWLSLEEAEVIEEASRRTGKIPAQFMKEAGLELAVALLGEAGREGESTTRGRLHPRPLHRNTYPPLKNRTKNKKARDQRQPSQPSQPLQPLKTKPFSVLLFRDLRLKIQPPQPRFTP